MRDDTGGQCGVGLLCEVVCEVVCIGVEACVMIQVDSVVWGCCVK